MLRRAAGHDHAAPGDDHLGGHGAALLLAAILQEQPRQRRGVCRGELGRTVSLHDDYIGERLFDAAPAVPAEPAAPQEDNEDEEPPSDDEVLEDLDEPADNRGASMEKREVRRPDGTMVKKPFYKLSYKRASELLRPQHALVYASIQSRTMRNSLGLMDLDSKNMTTRDIITAMSRPISGADLHFVTPEQQRTLFHDIEAKKVDFDLLQRVLQSRQQEPSERRTPSRVGR